MIRSGGTQIGEIEDLGNFVQRYLLPIQSFTQSLWLLVAVGAGLLTIFTLDVIGGFPHAPLRGWLMGAVAALGGALPSMIASLPARFVIRAAGNLERGAIRDFLIDRLMRMGYAADASAGKETVLKKAKYRWLSWSEGTVRIGEFAERIEVRGPKFIVRRLHERANAALRG